VILPIFPLTLKAGAKVVAKSLSGAVNFEEISALRIGADTDIARLKEFPPQHAIEQGSNSEEKEGVHFWGVRKGKRSEHIHKFTDYDS
jgi:hypothetical protein